MMKFAHKITLGIVAIGTLLSSGSQAWALGEREWEKHLPSVSQAVHMSDEVLHAISSATCNGTTKAEESLSNFHMNGQAMILSPELYAAFSKAGDIFRLRLDASEKLGGDHEVIKLIEAIEHDAFRAVIAKIIDCMAPASETK